MSVPKEKLPGALEMAQWKTQWKMLSSKLNDMSLVPRTHTVEEN